MKAIVSQLNSLLSTLPEAKRRGQSYPDKIKELCVELAASVGVKEASRQSGIAQSSIYKWIRSGGPCKSQELASGPSDNPLQRPLVLQEVEVTAISPVPKETEITIVSAGGVTIRMPADDRMLELILDRMIGV